MACASTESTSPPTKISIQNEPKASSLRLKQQRVTQTGQIQDQVVEKALFEIVASPKRILVNGIQLDGTEALDTFLKKQKSPVLTLIAHKCLSPQATSKILSIVQAHTQSPIPFGTRGEFTDPECQ